MGKREDILGFVDYESEDVEVKKWGTTVNMRSMSAKASTRYFQAINDHESDTPALISFYPGIVADCAYADKDATEPMFSMDDAKELAKKDAHVISKLAAKALELSRLSGQAEAEAEKKSTEQAEKD